MHAFDLTVAAVSDSREQGFRRSESAATGGGSCSGGLRPPNVFWFRQSETAATISAVRQRLKRLDIVYQHFPIYFVTACTAKRHQLLASESIHSAFEEFADSAPKYGAWVGAYVLMPNHLHLFLAIDDQKTSLSKWMKSLKGTLSSVLRAEGKSPPYWQKGFFDHVLRSSDSYSEKWYYVRENPVRAGLTNSWSAWPYLGEIFDLQFHDARF
jgi:putative transposase